eukprot:2559981-Rhodomonas_salina.1
MPKQPEKGARVVCCQSERDAEGGREEARGRGRERAGGRRRERRREREGGREGERESNAGRRATTCFWRGGRGGGSEGGGGRAGEVPICLRACYAMSGTGIAYAAIRLCAAWERGQRTRREGGKGVWREGGGERAREGEGGKNGGGIHYQVSCATSQRACYAMSGTEIAYAATNQE